MIKPEEKKTPVVAAAAPAAKVEAPKAAAPAVKAEPAKKVEAKKPAAKKPAAKKAAPKVAAKKAAPKAAAKKPAAKKAPAKKAAAPKAAAKTEDVIVLQLGGAEWNVADVKAKVLAAAGKKTAKKVEIYVKPEDGKAYFVVDGKGGAVEL